MAPRGSAAARTGAQKALARVRAPAAVGTPLRLSAGPCGTVRWPRCPSRVRRPGGRSPAVACRSGTPRRTGRGRRPCPAHRSRHRSRCQWPRGPLPRTPSTRSLPLPGAPALPHTPDRALGPGAPAGRTRVSALAPGLLPSPAPASDSRPAIHVPVDPRPGRPARLRPTRRPARLRPNAPAPRALPLVLRLRTPCPGLPADPRPRTAPGTGPTASQCRPSGRTAARRCRVPGRARPDPAAAPGPHHPLGLKPHPRFGPRPGPLGPPVEQPRGHRTNQTQTPLSATPSATEEHPPACMCRVGVRPTAGPRRRWRPRARRFRADSDGAGR